MKKLLSVSVIAIGVQLTCNGQLTQSIANTNIKPIAPKGYVLISDKQAENILNDHDELIDTRKQLTIKTEMIDELNKQLESMRAIEQEQLKVIKKQKRQVFWSNVKMYSGWLTAAAILTLK